MTAVSPRQSCLLAGSGVACPAEAATSSKATPTDGLYDDFLEEVGTSQVGSTACGGIAAVFVIVRNFVGNTRL